MGRFQPIKKTEKTFGQCKFRQVWESLDQFQTSLGKLGQVWNQFVFKRGDTIVYNGKLGQMNNFRPIWIDPDQF